MIFRFTFLSGTFSRKGEWLPLFYESLLLNKNSVSANIVIIFDDQIFVVI